jgi:hypothetical protein
VAPARAAGRAEAEPVEAAALAFPTFETAASSLRVRADDMLRNFDQLQQQLRTFTDERQQALAVGVGVSGSLSIGYVVWLVRGGVLLSSVLSALPAWQMVDPLPVLAAAGAVRRTRGDAGRDGSDDVERLFDGPREPAPPPAPAHTPPPVPATAAGPDAPPKETT